MTAGPRLNVSLALTGADLSTAADLVKPAILYADDVTIYSLGASMIKAVQDVAAISDPRQQLIAVFEMAPSVPVLAEQLANFDPQTLALARQVMTADRRTLRAAGRMTGHGAEVKELEGHLDKLAKTWTAQMPIALSQALTAVNGEELGAAITSGAVKVADISPATSTDIVASALRAATGASAGDTTSDDLVQGYIARVVEILSQPSAFPLLDETTTGLIQALEREGRTEDAFSDHAMRHGSEVTAAARFMGYLPYFADLPVDEVLDLRGQLHNPLVRFRGAMTGLSRDFESRPIDDTFETEVSDAWRATVEPTLIDLREGLAEHGLLREAASIVTGDPRRLIAEAGGVFIAAHTTIHSLSSLMTAAMAAGLPLADVVGRALADSRTGRREVRSSPFFFLHRLGQEAERRTR